jgi:hypothetical protein
MTGCRDDALPVRRNEIGRLGNANQRPKPAIDVGLRPLIQPGFGVTNQRAPCPSSSPTRSERSPGIERFAESDAHRRLLTNPTVLGTMNRIPAGGGIGWSADAPADKWPLIAWVAVRYNDIGDIA